MSTELPLVAPLLSEPRQPTSTDSQDRLPARLSKVAPLLPRLPRPELCFDLENRPLAYWYDGQTTSEITAFGWKAAGDESVSTMVLCPDQTFEADDGTRYPYMKAHELFGDVLAGAGVVYGHNIRRHDLPMLEAWRLRLRLPSLPALLTTDTCRDIPKRNGVSVSLENLAAMYDLPVPKHRMTQPAWEQANQLRPDGISEARERVVGDVLLQEAVRRELVADGKLKAPRTWAP